MKKLLLTTIAAIALPAAAMAQPAPAGPTAIPPQMSTPSTTDNSSDASGTPMKAKLSMQDTHFIKVAAVAGLSEINDGNLASEKGDATVKNIGSTMVSDHTKANDQLTSIAKEKGVTPPTQVDATHAAVTAELKILSGTRFDKKYLKTELKGHELTIAAFKAEASTGSDADLKTFASDTLPTLEKHLSMIKAAMKEPVAS